MMHVLMREHGVPGCSDFNRLASSALDRERQCPEVTLFMLLFNVQQRTGPPPVEPPAQASGRQAAC
eukprot:375232-Rhodomonas_salina.1